MPIQFSCTNCGKRVQAPDLAVGKKAECPQCKTINKVPVPDGFDQLLPPPIVPPPAITPAEPKPPRKLPSWEDLAPIVWKTTLAVSIVGFLITVRTPPGPLVFWHYVGLMVAVGLIAYKLVKRFKPYWSIWIAIGAAIVAANLWSRWDYAIEHWTKPSDGRDGTYHYTDYIYRGNDSPFYRSMYVFWKNGGYYSAEGEFSESGKQHGKWHSHSFEDESSSSTDIWYWYGEPITEGDWHLRNQ
jgi:hypothetical protein